MNYDHSEFGIPYDYRNYLRSRYHDSIEKSMGKNSLVYGQSMTNNRIRPFYMTYPMLMPYENQEEQERDMEYLISMYPDAAKEIQVLIEEECDKMEYEGSLMFDDRPDKVMLMKICENIHDKVKDSVEEDFFEEEDINDGELFTMQYRPPRRGQRRKVGIEDIIEILLFNEMYRRRCRHRNCRRRRY